MFAVEEKYKNDGKNGDDDESSSDETEDEEGFLATEALDAQISATLKAIRTKDPRVYDKEVTFYKTEDKEGIPVREKTEKPIYLQDYHRQKIMRGDVGASDDEDDAPPKTFVQEQDALKKSIVSEMHAAKSGGESDSDDDFVVKRKEPAKPDANGVHPSRAPAIKVTTLDVTQADKDPESFLSNFMAARAWLPEEGSRWKAFDSDDEEDEHRADEFEQAYNLRFEDPSKSNEVLQSYSRDLTNSRSVRREDKGARQRKRDAEKERKEEERRERKEEKARLRKLKLEEAEEKLKKIKQAAGAAGAELRDEDWMNFLNDAWDDEKWEEEMNKRFGDDYYAQDENLGNGSGDEDGEGKKKRVKKPKWDDDIDIKDIVPDFDDSTAAPGIALTDDEQGEDEEDDDESRPSKKRKTSEHKRARLESQKSARQQRKKLEAIVDKNLNLNSHDALSSSSGGPVFRYRETSPQAFGMTSRDILLAPSDSALNDFAGLKKLASFRDPEKKRRDKKKLGKKARLRQWRKDHFGKEFEREGPDYGFERFVAEEDAAGHEAGGAGKTKIVAAEDGGVVDGERSKKKRKRSKGKKGAAEA